MTAGRTSAGPQLHGRCRCTARGPDAPDVSVKDTVTVVDHPACPVKLTKFSSTLVMVAFAVSPCSRTRDIASSLLTAIAPRITAPTKNAAASARLPRRVEVTFLTVIAITGRRVQPRTPGQRNRSPV